MDIRVPVGAIFAIYGLLLTIYGFSSGDLEPRHSYADRIESGGRDRRYRGTLIENDRERARKEGFDEFLRDGSDSVCELRHLIKTRDVSYQRVIGRPPLGLKYLRDGRFIEDVAAEAIDRLGRKCHDAATCYKMSGLLRIRC